ncbi:MAG TPA: hypothetical protein PLP35_02440 [Caldisericia bacterium]|nr:hypothetical protein [Caldisericia bacterium]HRV75164.1 hypothetical protein [Caldisericia bacterium]
MHLTGKQVGEYSKTIYLLKYYIKVLNRLTPFKLSIEDDKFLEQKTIIRTRCDYTEILLHIRRIIRKFTTHFYPIKPITEIVKKYRSFESNGNVKEFMLPLGFFRDSFKPIVTFSDDPNTPCDVEVTLSFGWKMEANQNGIMESDTLNLRILAPEKIALDEAGFLYKKIEMFQYTHKNFLEKIRTYGNNTGNENPNIYNEIIREYQKLGHLIMIYSNSFILRIHSFLDKFLNRVINTQYSKIQIPSGVSLDEFMRKNFDSRLDAVLWQPTQIDTNNNQLYIDFDKYKNLRNKITHGLKLSEMDTILLEYNDLESLNITYIKIARMLWKHYYAEEYPQYLQYLGRDYSDKVFNLDTEVISMLDYAMRVKGKMITRMNNKLREYGYQISRIPIANDDQKPQLT